MPVANPPVIVGDEDGSVQPQGLPGMILRPRLVAVPNPSGKWTERQVVDMATGEQSLGLCLTCNNKDICVQREGIKFPVLSCEEFDDSTSLRAERPMASALPEEKTVLDTGMGLCCNCGNCDSCTLRHAPGGIWHCEQYC